MPRPPSLTPVTPLENLPRLNRQTLRDFAKLGLQTVRDLLYHFPFRHEDFSQLVPIKNLKIGQRASLRCQVTVIKNSRSFKKRRLFTEALFRDETGSVKAIWFNQPYLPKLLRAGGEVIISGVLEESYFGLHLTNPIFERIQSQTQTIHTGRLVPIYATRGSLTARQIRALVWQTLGAARQLPDRLPEEIRQTHHLLPIATAVRNLHFPANLSQLEEAKRRLGFEELFLAQLTGLSARRALEALAAPTIPFGEAVTKTFVETLPFALTASQRRSSWEILQDLGRARPMNRLLEGEVGSGKTVVAALAILNAALAGFQVAYLAPTELLAIQQAKTLGKLFQGFSVSLSLLTAGLQQKNGEEISRRSLEQAIASGEINLVIGTHALLQKRVNFSNLGLVIIDEQHRFGVEQRKKLCQGKGLSAAVPHFLSMTATPIPRTLALTAYGDLDISLLNELPKGRQPVTTKLAREMERPSIYAFIRQKLNQGQQALVVCPLISESDKLGVAAATKEAEKLRGVFYDQTIGLLHGKLSTKEKQEIMDGFRKNSLQILVATAVIEVGLDVPNATLMIIEGAERFGLAQLHQFRGRIGRGNLPSHCFLFTDDETGESVERLLIFSRSSNGFELAERDLELRGPGEIFGLEQSGFPRFRMTDLHDQKLVEETHQAALRLLTQDPPLESYPLLRQHCARPAKDVHLE